VDNPANQSMHMKIRIHYRDQHSGPWATVVREVDQIPQISDFIAPAPRKVFRVVLTLHVLFEADYDAEVFAELVDFQEVQSETLGEEVWLGCSTG
jgi:hypothetical protein